MTGWLAALDAVFLAFALLVGLFIGYVVWMLRDDQRKAKTWPQE